MEIERENYSQKLVTNTIIEHNYKAYCIKESFAFAQSRAMCFQKVRLIRGKDLKWVTPDVNKQALKTKNYFDFFRLILCTYHALK